MTPFYIVIGTDNQGDLCDVERPIAYQKQALEEAKKETLVTGRPSYVF